MRSKVERHRFPLAHPFDCQPNCLSQVKPLKEQRAFCLGLAEVDSEADLMPRNEFDGLADENHC